MSYEQPQPPVNGPAYPPPPYAPPGQGQQGYAGWPPPPAPKKRWGAGRITLVIVGGLLALCLIGAVNAAVKGGDKASVSKPAGTSAAKAADAADDEGADEPGNEPGGGGGTFNAPVGSTMTVTASDGAVMEATLSGVKLHKGGCGEYGAKPENGSYLIANVVVVQKKGTGSVNPLDFTFVADDGTTANALGGGFSGCLKNDLTSTNALRAGSRRSGQIAFDVAGRDGAVEYAPGGIGSEAVGSWKIN